MPYGHVIHGEHALAEMKADNLGWIGDRRQGDFLVPAQKQFDIGSNGFPERWCGRETIGAQRSFDCVIGDRRSHITMYIVFIDAASDGLLAGSTTSIAASCLKYRGARVPAVNSAAKWAMIDGTRLSDIAVAVENKTPIVKVEIRPRRP